MSQLVIAKRYAKALLKLVEKEKAFEKISGELSEISESFTTSSDLQKVLADTKIPNQTKRAIVQKILELHKSNSLVSTFIQYLLVKKRIMLLPDIESVFSGLVREKLGRLEAEIIVAHQLTEAKITEITKKLSEYSGKEVHVSVKVDESIIGGVVTRIGSEVIDGSLRNQLNLVYQSIIRG